MALGFEVLGAPPCRCPSWGAGDPRTLDFLVVLLQLTLGDRDTGSWAVGHLEKEACVEIDSVSMEDCRGDPSGPPPSLLASLGSNSPNSPGATSQHTHGTRFPFCHSRRWRSSPGHSVTPTPGFLAQHTRRSFVAHTGVDAPAWLGAGGTVPAPWSSLTLLLRSAVRPAAGPEAKRHPRPPRPLWGSLAFQEPETPGEDIAKRH